MKEEQKQLWLEGLELEFSLRGDFRGYGIA